MEFYFPSESEISKRDPESLPHGIRAEGDADELTSEQPLPRMHWLHISLPEIGEYTISEIFDNKKCSLASLACSRRPIGPNAFFLDDSYIL